MVDSDETVGETAGLDLDLFRTNIVEQFGPVMRSLEQLAVSQRKMQVQYEPALRTVANYVAAEKRLLEQGLLANAQRSMQTFSSLTAESLKVTMPDYSGLRRALRQYDELTKPLIAQSTQLQAMLRPVQLSIAQIYQDQAQMTLNLRSAFEYRGSSTALARSLNVINGAPPVAAAFEEVVSRRPDTSGLGVPRFANADQSVERLEDALDAHPQIREELDDLAPQVARGAHMPDELLIDIGEYMHIPAAIAAAGRDLGERTITSIVVGGGITLALGVTASATGTLTVESGAGLVALGWEAMKRVDMRLKRAIRR